MLILSMDNRVGDEFARDVLDVLDRLDFAEREQYHLDVFVQVMLEIAPGDLKTIYN